MANKPPNPSPEYTGTQVLSAFPPSLSLDSGLLGSAIPLPHQARISYRVFVPTSSDTAQGARDVEVARQCILSQQRPSLLDSLLPSTHVAKDTVSLHVFALGSSGAPSEAASEIHTLSFDALTGSELASFSPGQLYPCSDACVLRHDPCPRCPGAPPAGIDVPASAAPTPLSIPDASRSAACLLPRKPLRDVLARFLDAVRCRLIDDIAERAGSEPDRTPVRRLRGGFLLGPSPRSSEWATGWERQSSLRPLIHCQLQIRLTPSRLIIQPILRPTSYLPLALPTAQGTPITLLPYATPAYYLSTYSGSTSSLTQQFTAALGGLGVGAWARADTGYVIAWVGVQNTQGEAKGTTIVWPTSLCVGLHPASAAARTRVPLAHVPDLPMQLQFSPPPVSAPVTPRPRLARTGTGAVRRPLFNRGTSAPSDAARTLRAIALSRSKPVRAVAADVSAYVDAVARDREREREKIRRERDAPKASKAPAAATLPTPPEGAAHSPAPLAPLLAPLGPAFAEAEAPHVVVPKMEDMSSEPAPLPPAPIVPEPAPPPVIAQPVKIDTPESFNPFGSFDTAWPAPNNDFMDVNMDYDLGFGLNADVDSIGGPSSGATGLSLSTVDGAGRMDLDFDGGFDTFTADDFSFFDDPVVAEPAPSVVMGSGRAVPVPPLSIVPETLGSPGAGLTPAAGPAPLGFSPSAFVAVSPHSAQISPWLSAPFSPSILKIEHPVALPTPQSTPATSSASEPPTPAVHLATLRGGPPSPTTARLAFDAIPFAPAHRLADGKYALGKFALPSPPDDDVRTPPPSLPSSPPGAALLSAPVSWLSRYHAATDPRVGMVRKLIGVKRKCGAAGAAETRDRTAPWAHEYEEWTDAVPRDGMSDGSEKSEPETEDDDDDIDVDELDIPRPSTPPPSWLPHGPALLCTHFHHSQLLPLSTPLRTGGATVPPANVLAIAPPPASVPTPVSPAAVTGATLEKARSLEAAAQVLALEVVDNCVWADAWMAAMPPERRTSGEIWQHDIKAVESAIDTTFSINSKLTLKMAFTTDEGGDGQESSSSGSPTLSLLDPPSLTVGKSDAIIQVLPPALRFWEKLGLIPRAGKKDLEAYVLFEDTGDERRMEVQAWLASVSALYTAKNYGKHLPGNCRSCILPGLVPMNLDSFRKEFANFIQNLPLPTAHAVAVLYVILPDANASLDSLAFRQVLSVVKRALRLEGGALFHLVPDDLVRGCAPDRAPPCDTLDAFTRCLYDRLHEPVKRAAAAHVLSGSGAALLRRFYCPSFALARPRRTTVSFVREAAVRALDVIDRYTLLHVGYALSACGRWIVAACVDQRGEAHDVHVWLNPALGEAACGTDAQLQVVGLVWGFALQFARRANVEWRVVVSRLGPMGEVELDAWTSHLHSALHGSRESAPMHVFVLSIGRDVGWTFTTPSSNTPMPTLTSPSGRTSAVVSASARSASKDAQKTLMADVSTVTYAVLRRAPHMLKSMSPGDVDIGEDASFVLEASAAQIDGSATLGHDTSGCFGIGLLPRATASLVGVPAGTDFTTVSTLDLHLLHSMSSFGSALGASEEQTLEDAARNFHELAVLARERWRGAITARTTVLPFHLAAAEVVLAALRGAEESFVHD